MKKYEFTDHTADMGLRIFGRNPAELFENAGHALCGAIGGSAGTGASVCREFVLERDAMDELLVEWLNSLLYVFDTERILFSSFAVVSITDTDMVAEARGERLSGKEHADQTVVKAVTYHGLSITRQAGVWVATVILDV